jgi:hypothetical protein
VEFLAGSAEPLRRRRVRPGFEGSFKVVVSTAVPTISRERFWSDAQPRELLRLGDEQLPSRQRACDTVAAGLGKRDAPGILGLHFPDEAAHQAIEVAISGKPAKGGGRLGWTCSYGPSSGLGSHGVVVCTAAAGLRRRTWLTCLSRAMASCGRSAHSIMRTGELGPKLLDTTEILGTCLDATDAASRGSSLIL